MSQEKQKKKNTIDTTIQKFEDGRINNIMNFQQPLFQYSVSHDQKSFLYAKFGAQKTFLLIQKQQQKKGPQTFEWNFLTYTYIITQYCFYTILT